MSCSCSYSYENHDEDSDIVIWQESRVLRTRKEHRCYECSDVIPAGSRCCKATCLYEGSWWTAYRCVSCATYAEYISMETETCPLWGHLHDFVTDNEFNYLRPEGEELPTLFEWRERERRAS